MVPTDDALDLPDACLEVFSQVKDRTVMGSGEVTTPVMVSATVGLQKRTYFEMHYAVMFDDGQTARVHVTGKVANRLGIIDTVNETVELHRFEGGGSSGLRKGGSFRPRAGSVTGSSGISMSSPSSW